LRKPSLGARTIAQRGARISSASGEVMPSNTYPNGFETPPHG
jgi:hypothetical protein